MLQISNVPRRPVLYTVGSQFSAVVGRWHILSEVGHRRVLLLLLLLFFLFCVVLLLFLDSWRHALEDIESCPLLFLFHYLAMRGSVLLYHTPLQQYAPYLSVSSISVIKHWSKELGVERV